MSIPQVFEQSLFLFVLIPIFESSKLTALEVALVERVVPAVNGPGYGGHLAGHVAKEPAGVLGACAQAVGGEVELEFGN